ncbi:hypothetical protein ACM44_07750 [Chryseobacterium koreense CCUG 49689]|uniref:Uncharacterized protein n=1 Tax=Chryseobacterium koreense CCUG 49689 TaxID=1304281 RepID=A0A0J7IYG0_9FLAO|nr:hypothetical protein ACM44_07750 [Chryseobacterium koreense CCUG 49689]
MSFSELFIGSSQYSYREIYLIFENNFVTRLKKTKKNIENDDLYKILFLYIWPNTNEVKIKQKIV